MPRVGIVGSIADGVFGAVTYGKLRIMNKGFWELFGAILVSGQVVVRLSVVMVGTFGSAGAMLEGFFGVISDGASGAVADGKTCAPDDAGALELMLSISCGFAA
jgi:hypothetical protein